MTYVQTTPPAAEPLTLAEVKAHLRLDDEAEDALLLSLAKTARTRAGRPMAARRAMRASCRRSRI